MSNGTINLQKQIVENSQSINEYFKDLYDWEKDIKKRDKIVIQESTKNPIKNTIPLKTETEYANENKTPTVKLIKEKKDPQNKNLKRDVSSIKEYYKEWDKFDADSQNESDSEKEKEINPKGKIDFFNL